MNNFFINIFHITNISLAFFFCVWQLIISYCIYSGGYGDAIRTRCSPIWIRLADDSFYYLTFYLIFLLATIFFFLVAKEQWIEKVKGWKYFFLTVNIVFVAFLFFEV